MPVHEFRRRSLVIINSVDVISLSWRENKAKQGRWGGRVAEGGVENSRQAGWTIKRTGRKTVEEWWLSKSFSSPGAARISPVVAEGATIFSRKGRNEKKRERGGVKIKEGRNGKRKERRRTEAAGRGGLAWPEQMKPVQVSELYNSTTFLRSCPAETRRFTQDNFHVRSDGGRRWPPRW